MRAPQSPLPSVRLHRAVQRLGLAGDHLEAALAPPDPLGVEADVWSAAALAAAAAGDVALARHFSDGQQGTRSWPASTGVAARAASLRDLVSILRWQFETEDVPPRARVFDCLRLVDEALDDVAIVLADPAR